MNDWKRDLLRALVLAVVVNGVVITLVWGAEYAKRWCPAGTDPEANPHCLLQPYFGKRAKPKLPPPDDRKGPILLSMAVQR